MMKNILRNKWTDALESGEFIQATGQLKAQITSAVPEQNLPALYGYCCMGVLACVLLDGKDEIIIGEGSDEAIKITRNENENDPNIHVYELEDEDWPPETLSDTANFSDNLLSHVGLSRADQINLINMNDQHQKRFPEIAAWIKENIPVSGE